MNKDIVLLELFSGIGGFHAGLSQAGFNIKKCYFSEIDKHAIANYKYNFPEAEHLGSVTDVLEWDIERPNIITFGSPCFVAGTKVLSTNGFVNIESVLKGDKVITHTQKLGVVNVTNAKEFTGNIHTIRLHKDTTPIVCTDEHPFYCFEETIYWDNEARAYKKRHSEPKWVKACELTESHYVIVTDNTPVLPTEITVEEAYLMGYYMAEGWLDKTKRARDGKSMFRVFFAMHEKEKNHFNSIIDRIPYTGRFTNKKSISVSFNDKFEGKAIKSTISNEHLYNLCKKVGSKAINKTIPKEILFASRGIQKAFLDGYMYGDGCFIEKINQYQCQSMNVEMAYGIRQLVLSVYKELAQINYIKTKSKHIINGRTVNQSNYYAIRWKKEKTKQVFSYLINDRTAVKVKSNESEYTTTTVYNIGVSGDESYTLGGGYVVHNCQDFSLAGKRSGLKGARSSLIEYAFDAIERFRPDVFIWENVKGAYSSNAGADYWAIQKAFADLDGYRHEEQLLNSIWFVPQNRERIYHIGHLGEGGGCQVFPFGEANILHSKNNGGEKSGAANCLDANYSKGWLDHGQRTHIMATNLQGNVFENTLRWGGRGSLTEKHNWDYVISHYGHLDKEPVVSEVCPTLKAESHGHTPMVAHVSRSDEGKRLRRESMKEGKDYTPFQSKKIEFKEAEAMNTITCATQKDNLIFTTGIRRLTEVECERLQAYQDNWTKYGNYNGTVKEIASTNRYKLIGNAVTVAVVKEIGKRLLK